MHQGADSPLLILISSHFSKLFINNQYLGFYNKCLDLLQAKYKTFRYRIQNLLCVERLNFREAIKKTNLEESRHLQFIIDEDRIGI